MQRMVRKASKKIIDLGKTFIKLGLIDKAHIAVKGDLSMKKKLVIMMLSLVCFCMSGCTASTDSDSTKGNDASKTETTTDAQTEEKTESESETIMYDTEVNGEDEYYGNETELEGEYDDEYDDEYSEDIDE